MIRSFACAKTELLFNREQVAEFVNIESVARRRLLALNNAVVIFDLRIPRGKRLEVLSGDRQGQWSIRTNHQYRICFIWKEDGPHDVEITEQYR